MIKIEFTILFAYVYCDIYTSEYKTCECFGYSYYIITHKNGDILFHVLLSLKNKHRTERKKLTQRVT
jgi:hypothetical protein